MITVDQIRQAYNDGYPGVTSPDQLFGHIRILLEALDKKDKAPTFSACTSCGDEDLSDIYQQTGLCRGCTREI